MGFASRIGNALKAATSVFRASMSSPEGLLTTLGGYRTPVARDGAALEQAPGEIPWLSASLGLLMNMGARPQWHLYKALGKTSVRRGIVAEANRYCGDVERHEVLKGLLREGSLEEVHGHLLPNMINQGNPGMVGHDVRATILGLLDTTGLAYAVLDYNARGVPFRQWPIPPSWCRRRPIAEDRTYHFSYASWNAEIPEDRVICFRVPRLSNPYHEEHSHARALRDEFAISEFTAKHLSKFFFSDARPPVLLGGTAAKDNKNSGENPRADVIWKRKAQQGLPFWLSGKDWFVKELGHNFEQMQVVSLVKLMRDQIIQVHGIPPELFGIQGTSNRSTIDLAEYIFTRFQIEPRLWRLLEHYQTLLERYRGAKSNAVLAFDSPVPADKEFQLKVMAKQPHAFTQQEWRARADAAPREGADIHLVANRFQAVAQLDQVELIKPGHPAEEKVAA